MPHPSLWVFNVPFIPGDDVDMHMVDALSGRRSDIDADIVSIRFEFLIEEFSFLLGEVHAGSHFFRRQVEKAGDMATRDDQSMPRARRVAVTSAVSEFIL